MNTRTVRLMLCLLFVLLGVGLVLFAAVGMANLPFDDPFRAVVTIAGFGLGLAGVIFGHEAADDWQ